MERRKELADAAEEMQKELFASRIRELETEYRKPERREEVRKVFAGLFRRRERQGSGRAGCLGICYRYGSIRMGTYGLRLVLYGEDFCLDRNPTVCEWRPPCFFEMFEEDMAVILRKLKSAFPRIYAYEEDAVRLRCVEYYLAAVCRLCMDMEGEILCTEEFRRMERMDGFYVFFGRYRGEGEILYRAGKDAPEQEDRESGREAHRQDRECGAEPETKTEDKTEANTKAEYYVLTSQEGNSVPRPVNWYGKLDVRKMNRRDYGELPKHVLLDVKAGADAVYPDILTDPVLMVSPEARQVIKKYEAEMPFLFVVLCDTEGEEAVAYHCPVLTDVEENGECGEALYRVRTGKGSEVRIRSDLAESLLARGAVGLGLKKVADAERGKGKWGKVI